VGIAYTLQVVAQQWAKPAHAALILSLETVFGAVGGALVLGERMTARGYAGSLLILAGIMVSQLPRRASQAWPFQPESRDDARSSSPRT
jgi:drug/metabolite transporter (DMT)-like permease